MNVRCLAVWLVVVGLGCAHGPRKAGPQHPEYEHVFQKPLPEALAVARELLAAKGYTFEETEDPSQLLTRWQAPEVAGGSGNTRYTRYLVTGIAAGPRQSVVRMFRMTAETVGNDVSARNAWLNWLRETNERTADPRNQPVQLARGDSGPSQLRGNLRGTRDMELEKALTLRLESGPSIEVLSGNVQQDPLPTPVRDEDFYLTRWTDAAPEEEGLCGEAVRGLPELLVPGLTLLIGEQLGTREAPLVVGNVTCQAAQAGLPVVLGLSIPRTEQERLDRYLASPGAPVDQDTLLEGRFWQRPYQDGRSSRAIFDLIDRVRAMRAAGMRVALVAYDTDTARASERDAELAKVWRERRKAHPHEVHVVLAGNTHTRTTKGAAWDQGFTPMAHHLRDGLLVVLEMSYAQGTRWGCDLNRAGKLTCGFVGSTPSGKVAAMPGQSPYIRRIPDEDEGFHGLLYVGEITPSLPAISKHKEAPPPSRMPTPPGVKHPPMF